MSIPENDFQILKLTEAFYKAYPNPPYKEILKKKQRAYKCLLFQTHYDYFICVPYRTEINHNCAFHFSNTKRSEKNKSGIDYTKIVIITKKEYIDSADAMIDKDEYKETINNLAQIKKEALEFVEDYVAHIKGQKTLHRREFNKRYRFSPLKYFHNELGIL